MVNLRSGVKIYDNAWFLHHGLEPEEAADFLSTLGVTYVITQSRYLPMSDSAVKSAVELEQGSRYAKLDDFAFREALKARNIAYFACLNICFDPALTTAHPQLLPIDQFGHQASMQDWYIGMPPYHQLNLQHKIGLLTKAIPALAPDGVHLGFIRWPGFWETWLPETDPQMMPDYCYGQESLELFTQNSGIELPTSNPVEAAAFIAEYCPQAWRDWKCALTCQAISTIREAISALQPDIPIAINTVPFFADDFAGAVSCIFGQDITKLKDVVDIFEVMAYHQILKRDTHWPASITNDIKQRSQGKKAICTIQAKAIYLDGMHAGKGRQREITSQDFAQMLHALEKSETDGVCVFTFSDLLDLRETKDGHYRLDALRAFRR